MAIAYNQIGSLRELLDILKDEGINDFQTLDEIRKFRDNFDNLLDDIRIKNKELLDNNIVKLESERKNISEVIDKKLKVREELLKKEQKEIPSKIAELENKRSKILIPVYWIRKKILLRRKNILETNFEKILKRPFWYKILRLKSVVTELDDKKNNTEKWIDSMSEKEIKRAQFILSALVENKLTFYGAEGEERAVNELKKLPDTYVIINDYRKNFKPPLYDRKDNAVISSIQIDHLVVGPTGVHIIETKNWSQKSVNSRDLFSPVQQLMRTSYAVFIILNNAIANGELNSFFKKWGKQKISPKNYILLMDHKPTEVYQFVKIVPIPEINKYITHGNEIYSDREVSALEDFLK